MFTDPRDGDSLWMGGVYDAYAVIIQFDKASGKSASQIRFDEMNLLQGFAHGVEDDIVYVCGSNTREYPNTGSALKMTFDGTV